MIPNPDIILSTYFHIHPQGVEVCPGIEPTEAAWEALAYSIVVRTDTSAWQIGAVCNKYPKKYRKDMYTFFHSLTSLSTWTIQQYAHIERCVPYEARVEGLSIWLHRPVARIEESDAQQGWLIMAKEKGWSVDEFERQLKNVGVEVEEHHYQSDKSFEDDKRQYDMANDLAETRRKLEEAETELNQTKALLETTPKTEALSSPSTGPDLTDLDWTHLLQVKDTLIDNGYTSVTIHSNGDITWHK